MSIRAKLSMARYHWHKAPDKASMWLAWHLPRKVAYWASIRVMAHATTGAHSDTVVPTLTALEVLERWDPAPTSTGRVSGSARGGQA